ncbi:MAG: DUF4339 domain-containing protein [Opitutales bacterium]
MSQILVNKDDQQIGPFSVDEINWKLESGELVVTDEAWMDGMPDWKPLAAGAFTAIGVELPTDEEYLAEDEGEIPPAPLPPPASPPPGNQIADKIRSGGKEILEGTSEFVSKVKAAKDESEFLPYLKLIDSILRWSKNLFTLQWLEKMDGASRKIGLLASAGGALLMLVFGIITSIKMGEAEPALYHALVLPGVAIAQFIAIKFLGAGRNLIDKSPGQISSKAFLECFALLLGLAAIGVFSWGAYTSIKAGEFLPVLAGVGLAMVLLYGVGASLNHESVNVQLKKNTSIGEEAIGLFAFLVKFLMRLVPFVFGVTTGIAFIGMAYSLIRLIGAEGYEAAFYIQSNYQYFENMVWALLLPFTAYVVFLVYYLAIDLMRAILCLFQLKKK